ncbi:Bug family tripartite tricarboxylate transporter substrate binding protein [Sneathiella sp.]|uniref:Bug family tripartite tricarboxylate transporter substrate binding protein n=1 Tax=Sneathiella sp. TaxID=1964365 RepID=UPI003561CC1D
MTKKLWTLFTFAIAIVFLSVPASADEYPSRPIKIVHGSSAGAPQDVMLRKLAESMTKAAGVAVVVEPRPGGTGQVAMAYLKGQAADGYTIFSDATGITSVLQLPGAAYKWTDFTPLYRIQLDPFALYVKRDGKYASLKDLLKDMKAHPEEVRIGGYGTGSPHQLTALFLADEADVQLNWVPYKSGSDAIAAVMAGDLDAAMSNISVYNRFKEKTLVIGVTSEERVKAHPDVPTIDEQGFKLARYHWRGMFVNNGTDPAVVDKLYAIVDKGVNSEEFQAYLTKSSTLQGTMSRADFVKMLEVQAANDAVTLKKIGMIKD